MSEENIAILCGLLCMVVMLGVAFTLAYIGKRDHVNYDNFFKNLEEKKQSVNSFFFNPMGTSLPVGAWCTHYFYKECTYAFFKENF